MILPVTLCAAAAAAVIAIWLMIRVGRVRGKEQVFLGDGGNEAVIRRMRAHSNYIESAPFVLALIAVVEISGKGGVWLPYVAALFFLGRIAHAIGMEGDSYAKFRFVGTIITMLTLLGMAIVAALIALGVM